MEKKTSNQLSPSTGPKVLSEAGKNPIFSLDMYAMNVLCVDLTHMEYLRASWEVGKSII